MEFGDAARGLRMPLPARRTPPALQCHGPNARLLVDRPTTPLSWNEIKDRAPSSSRARKGEESERAFAQASGYFDGLPLTRTICVALVKKVGRLTGVEFRCLRPHLRLSQKALARRLGNTEQSVANWEETGRVPLWADKHVRIPWQAAKDGNETVKRVVARLNEVERLVKQRIVVEETSRGWRSRIDPATVQLSPAAPCAGR